MKKTILAAALGLALIGPTAASAQFKTGNDLLADCSSKETTSRIYCLGYVAGANDSILRQLSGSGEKLCAPDRYTTGQLRDMVINLLVEKPEHRHLPAEFFVLAAYIRAWGC